MIKIYEKNINYIFFTEKNRKGHAWVDNKLLLNVYYFLLDVSIMYLQFLLL